MEQMVRATGLLFVPAYLGGSGAGDKMAFSGGGENDSKHAKHLEHRWRA